MCQIPLARPPRRALAACSLVILGACTTWRDQSAPLPTAQRSIDGPLRITRGDGYSILLDGADVRGDSIIGLSRIEKRRVSIPLAEVRRLEQRHDDILGSVALAALVTAATFGAYIYSVLAFFGSD